MKNRRRSCTITAIAAITYIATILPVYADTSPIISDNMIGSMDDPYFWEIFDTVPADPGAVSYVIDFFDNDGSILDSRIYQYGERLENIKTQRSTRRSIKTTPQVKIQFPDLKYRDRKVPLSKRHPTSTLRTRPHMSLPPPMM